MTANTTIIGMTPHADDEVIVKAAEATAVILGRDVAITALFYVGAILADINFARITDEQMAKLRAIDGVASVDPDQEFYATEEGGFTNVG